MGSDGWELVNIIPFIAEEYNTEFQAYYWKRQIPYSPQIDPLKIKEDE